MNAPAAGLSSSIRLADLADPDDCARIERFLADHPQATPFHRPAWFVAVAGATGNRALALVQERGGEIAAFLPLDAIHSPVFGRSLVSSGFAVDGGLLLTPSGDAPAMLAAVEELALRHSCPSIELRGGVLPEAGPRWSLVDDTHCTFARDLALDDEAELLTVPRKQRAEVRKALASDLDVEVGRADADRLAHYTVFRESYRNLGTPVFPKALLDAVMDAFGEDADILTVRHQGAPVASVISLYHRGTVMPYWGGGTFAARALRANERMYFELMLHAGRRGCTRFDFGRSKTGSGAYHYKRNWGFEPRPLTYAVWSEKGGAPRKVSPADPDMAARIALWKRLPLGVANRLGPFIARGIG